MIFFSLRNCAIIVCSSCAFWRQARTQQVLISHALPTHTGLNNNTTSCFRARQSRYPHLFLPNLPTHCRTQTEWRQILLLPEVAMKHGVLAQDPTLYPSVPKAASILSKDCTAYLFGCQSACHCFLSFSTSPPNF